jgi:hypothetical protein
MSAIFTRVFFNYNRQLLLDGLTVYTFYLQLFILLLTTTTRQTISFVDQLIPLDFRFQSIDLVLYIGGQPEIDQLARG